METKAGLSKKLPNKKNDIKQSGKITSEKDGIGEYSQE